MKTFCTNSNSDSFVKIPKKGKGDRGECYQIMSQAKVRVTDLADLKRAN